MVCSPLHNERVVLQCEQIPDCRLLAEVGYYESRNQSDKGVLAVMQVVLNRVDHPKWPNTVKEVIYNKCEFSYTCDGSIGRRKKNNKQWYRMHKLANKLLSGKVSANIGKSTHYHSDKVVPYWSKIFKRTGRIGNHIYYICFKSC